MVYPSPHSGVDDDNVISSSKSKNKKSKFNVKDFISSTNQCRSDMSSAIIDLASNTKKNSTSSEDISLKRDIWEDKKEYMDKKLQEKYSYRKVKSRLETNKMMLDILKQDRDDTITNYKEEDGEELKRMFKSDYINFARLYFTKLKQFVSQSSEIDGVNNSRDNTQETVCSSSSDSVTIMKGSTHKRKFYDYITGCC